MKVTYTFIRDERVSCSNKGDTDYTIKQEYNQPLLKLY